VSRFLLSILGKMFPGSITSCLQTRSSLFECFIPFILRSIILAKQDFDFLHFIDLQCKRLQTPASGTAARNKARPDRDSQGMMKEPTTTISSTSHRRPRLAACLVCRRSKIKCDWVPDQPRCKRCLQLGRECVRPDVHVGRQKGIKK
jgi:Fungal Zn(2)-Cys(6) binuclear cluster domain